MRLLLSIVPILLVTSTLCAQDNDSIVFNLTFYFEDAVGNRDTIQIGGSPFIERNSFNPSWGEINLVNEPFDSIFEVRVTNARNLEFGMPVNVISKKKILYYPLNNNGPFPCAWGGGLEGFAFVANVSNPPLRISWDPVAFRREENIGCLMATSIVNSFIVSIIPQWWNIDQPPGRTVACVGSESSKEFPPLDTPTGIDIDWLTYAVLPVAGSPNAADTLQAYLLNWERNNGPPPPCNLVVDTEVSPQKIDFITYPNPARDILYLKGHDDNSIFTVFSLNGQPLFSKSLQHENQVDIRNLAPGVYFYELVSPEGRASGKFVKQ